MQDRSDGWFLMHRGWADNPIFAKAEFCPRMAWLWLIENACWEPKRVRIAGKTILLARGQLSYSRSYLSEAWGWTESRVARFVNALQTDQMIDRTSEQGQMVISICNYDKYQDAKKISDRQSDRQSDRHRTGSEHNKKELKEVKEDSIPPTPFQPTFELESENPSPPKSAIDDQLNSDFENLWSAWKPSGDMDKGSKSKAKTSYLKARKDMQHGKIISSCRQYLEFCHRNDRSTQHVVTWLNQRRFDDEFPAAGASRSGKPAHGRPAYADSLGRAAQAAGNILDEKARLRKENDAE